MNEQSPKFDVKVLNTNDVVFGLSGVDIQKLLAVLAIIRPYWTVEVSVSVESNV